MPHLTFAAAHKYRDSEVGITVEVELIHGIERARLDAKVDTGSEYCMFQRGQGEAIGLEIETGERKEFRTANSNFWAYGHRITFTTLGHNIEGLVYFFADEGIRRNVLGRRAWLDGLRIAIVHYESTIYISPYND